MKTLYDALNAYEREVSEADFKQIRTALVRYVVPGWGGPTPTGSRMKHKEIEAGLDYLRQVDLSKISEAKQVQEKVFEQLKVSKASRRNYRYQLGRFIDWAQSKKLLSKSVDPKSSTTNVAAANSLRSQAGQRRERPEEYWRRMGFDRKVGEVLCLKDEELPPELLEQIRAYETYRLKTVRSSTFIIEKRRIKRYLGWLHRYKGIALKDLRLEKIIPVVKLKYSEVEFLDSNDPFLQAALAERKAQHQAESIAPQVLSQIEEYLATATKTGNIGAATLIRDFILLAKWMYNDETRAKFSDVPIIENLRALKQRYDHLIRQDPPAIPYALKSASWLDLFKVLRVLKTEADTTHRSNRNQKGGRRTNTAIGRSIQRLLILSMFVAMPPRRSRVITELEFGKTLKRGQVDKDRGFIPENLLEPHETSHWCIVLNPRDYKTGSIYGSQSWEINNMEYGDGTYLYDYLEKWVTEYRNAFSPNHNRLFVTVGRGNWGKPATIWTINRTIKNCTLRVLGRPITPKEIRKMFVSHISNRQDMTEADLEAAARAMAHSRQMQKQVYDQVTSEARLATGMDLANRIWQEAIEQTS